MSISILTTKQTKVYGWTIFTEGANKYRIRATVRYDDSCRNGHNSFSLTGEIEQSWGNRWRPASSGMIHDEIAKHFPELAPFLKWHLCGSDGPMHYVANTLFSAGDRDCHGLRKGEVKQQYDARGAPLWEPEIPASLTTLSSIVASHGKPEPKSVTVTYKPYGRIGEGKERDLAAARACAIWPDVTNTELITMSDNGGLEAALLDRLPVLMREFKAAVESLGLVY